MNSSNFFYKHREVRRDTEYTERCKIVFQFVLMLIASVLCGIFFTRLLSDEYLNSVLFDISKHFNAPFRELGEPREILMRYLSYCLSDLCCIVLVYLFSFSFINYAVTDMVIVFCGFKFGLSAALIWKITFVRIGFANCILFFALRGVLLVILLIYSYRMAIYSLHIRRFSSNGRAMIGARDFLNILLLSISVLGSILIINGLYCLLIYIF